MCNLKTHATWVLTHKKINAHEAIACVLLFLPRYSVRQQMHVKTKHSDAHRDQWKLDWPPGSGVQ